MRALLSREEATGGENLSETRNGMKTIRAEVERRNADCVLLAEGIKWRKDALSYFGEGDECHKLGQFERSCTTQRPIEHPVPDVSACYLRPLYCYRRR